MFFELFKLLFRVSKPNIEIVQSKFDVSTLPPQFITEFVEELKQELLSDIDFDEILSNNELYFTIFGIHENLEVVKNNTTLSTSEIQTIRKLLQEKFETNFDKIEFQRIYSANVLTVLSQVNFIGLGIKSHIKKNRKKLQDIYVKPRFGVVDPKFRKTLDDKLFIKNNRRDYHDDADETLSFDKLFSLNRNLVILGNPGSGKSFLVKKIICSLLEKTFNDFENKMIFEFTPFRVELRKYHQFKKDKNYGIVKYILSSLESEYGIVNTPEKPFINMLKEEGIFVFFDGLDEIFNANDKHDIKTDIENFISNHKNVKAIVTSRIIGYDEAKLGEANFCELKVLDFNNKQISEYVSKWYEQEELDDEIRLKEISEFSSKQNKIDRELIKNPLLLSLIVILFRNNLKIPDSKLEIYQSCTKTLVEKWDSIKDLKIELNEQLNKKKESLFADLAFWQYKKLSSKKISITNEQAINNITESIIKKHKITDDWIEAEKLAQEFFHYALKRSLYFDNNFTHKTFLEYFAAYWIYSNIEKKHKTKERDELISKYIGNSFWFIVLELLINMIDQDQPDTEIMEGIYELQRKKQNQSLPFLLTILPTIKNVSASYKVDFLINAIKIIIDDSTDKRHGLPSKLFESLDEFCNNDDNLKYFIEASNKVHLDVEKNEKSLKRFYSLIAELGLFSGSQAYREYKNSIFETPSYLDLETKDSHLLVIKAFETNNNEEGFFSVFEKFVNYFGAHDLFNFHGCVYAGIQFGPFINFYYGTQFSEATITSFKENFDILESKGLSRKEFSQNLLSRGVDFHTRSDLSVQTVANLFCTENDPYLQGIYLLLFHSVIQTKDVNLNQIVSLTNCKGYNHIVKATEMKSDPFRKYLAQHFFNN